MSDFIVPGVVAVLIVGLIVLVWGLALDNDRRATNCEARGGTWYHPYKSSGICLAPGMVLP